LGDRRAGERRLAVKTIDELKATLSEAVSEERYALIGQIWGELCGEIAADIPLERLEEICNAERDGRLVVLPCKTEDTVFIVYAKKKMLETTVDKRAWTDDDGYMLRTKEEWFKEKDIGKTVFLTREEAEKALEVW